MVQQYPDSPHTQQTTSQSKPTTVSARRSVSVGRADIISRPKDLTAQPQGSSTARRNNTSSARTASSSSRRSASTGSSRATSARTVSNSGRRAGTTQSQSSSIGNTILDVLAKIGSIILSLLLALLRVIGSVGQAIARGFMGLSGRAKLIVIALVCVVIIVFGVIRGCSAEVEQPVAETVVVEPQPLTAQDAHIPSGLDADVSKALSTALESNFSEDLVTICNEADKFDVDGPEVQKKLLLLAANDIAARPNLIDFPTAYPQKTGQPYNETVEKGSVPLLYQWDKRWGNTTYSSAPFSATGCAPTAFSMIYMGLTGKSDVTPYDMGVRATQGGFETTYNGTANGFFEAESSDLGIICTELDIDSAYVTDVLKQGCYVICNAGDGDFSSYGGHFFVITKVNDDGTWTINDPYSSVNSSHSWDPDTITDQSKAFWAFSMA